jgi:hypothetical protein
MADMVSQRKLEANRRNAQRSTGPKTAEGKVISRMNAWIHGFRAVHILGPGERLADFEAHCRLFIKDLRPWDETSTRLVLHLAECQWRLDRAGHYESRVLASGAPLSLQLRKLDRLTQYESRLMHQSDRCLDRLMRQLDLAIRMQAKGTSPHNRGDQARMRALITLYLGSFVQNPIIFGVSPLKPTFVATHPAYQRLIRYYHEGVA